MKRSFGRLPVSSSRREQHRQAPPGGISGIPRARFVRQPRARPATPKHPRVGQLGLEKIDGGAEPREATKPSE
jgi:hypothetical protein